MSLCACECVCVTHLPLLTCESQKIVLPLLFLSFKDKFLLCIPGCPVTNCMAKPALKFAIFPGFPCPGTTVLCHHAWHHIYF